MTHVYSMVMFSDDEDGSGQRNCPIFARSSSFYAICWESSNLQHHCAKERHPSGFGSDSRHHSGLIRTAPLKLYIYSSSR